MLRCNRCPNFTGTPGKRQTSMNAIFLKWLSLSLIGAVVLASLWLAESVRSNNNPPIRAVVAKPAVVVLAAVR